MGYDKTSSAPSGSVGSLDMAGGANSGGAGASSACAGPAAPASAIKISERSITDMTRQLQWRIMFPMCENQ
jgi:hypothetical protein